MAPTHSTDVRAGQPLKILFTEGSSTSARQSLYALGRLGHTIDLCDPQRLCLGRFSRYVRRWYRCPSFTKDPAGYLTFLHERLRQEQYDVLFPTHDQVYLLSRFREPLGRIVGLALPDFESLAQVQSKTAFTRLLARLGLPQPPTEIVAGPADLENGRKYPCFVKQIYSTAGCGVTLVRDAEDMHRFVERLRADNDGRQAGEWLVQQRAFGEYGVVQTVFQRGVLVGAHCYRARARGVGGSAHARESASHPLVIEHVAVLGAALSWHGALHMEYFFDPATGEPQYIEANPRIGETLNATHSGVNLCELLMRVSLDEPLPPPPISTIGVRTHSVLMSLLAKAEQGAVRRELWSEIWHAWRQRGVYADSREELMRSVEDARSLIPAAAVTARLLTSPRSAHGIVRNAVENYSMSRASVAAMNAVPSDWLDDRR